MVTRTFIFLAFVAATCGCERFEKLASGFPTPPPENTTPFKEPAELQLKPDTELQRQIESIVAEAKGTVGVAALVLETGESVSINADTRFAMQSVYKLHIAMAVLQAIDAELLALDEQIGVTQDDFVGPGQRSPIRDAHPKGTALTVRELIKYSMTESDGSASDVLLRLAGGPDAVQSYLTAIGVNDVAVVNTGKEIPRDWQTQYENWTTPNAAVKLLRRLQDGNGISAENRSLLLEYMTNSSPGARRLKGLLPAGTAVAHKTGTSGTRNGITPSTNDIGIIKLPNGDHMLIAVFVGDSPADEKTRERVIAGAARSAWDKFGK